MTNLNAVNVGMNKYCGPAVLSILTGKSTDECARVISGINGDYQVAGVQLQHLLSAASKLGFDTIQCDTSGSLYGTLVYHSHNDGMYIITLPRHFVCIEIREKQIYFCDNHTKEPMPAASSARLLQKVMAMHKVVKRRVPVQTSAKVFVQINQQYSGGPYLIVKKAVKYDVESANRIDTLAMMRLDNEQELQDLFDSLKGQIDERRSQSQNTESNSDSVERVEEE